MATLWQDVRYSLRSLLRSPGFSSLAVLTMALGIGANAAIFSVINGVLLSPLPYQDPDRLVRVWGQSPSVERGGMAPPDVEDLAAQGDAFESMVGFTSLSNPMLRQGEATRVTQALVSVPFFRVLGVQPALGRFFNDEEGQPGRHEVVVLSYGLWKRALGGASSVLGQSVTMNDTSYTIIGVAPADFRDPILLAGEERVDLWRPLVLRPDPGARSGHWLSVVARLKPGVTVEEAQREASGIAAQLEQTYPESNSGWRVRVEPLLDSLVGEVRPALLLLFAAVGLVLLIACVDLANLMLVRASSRQPFYVIRAAFGGRQREMIRQLLTESALLAVAGGACGLLVAFLLTRWFTSFSLLPRQDQIGLDWRVVAFTFSVSLLTGLLFGLFPALQMSRPDLNELLKEGGRGASAGARPRRLRNLLIVAETALALVLLIGAGLMIKSFYRLQGVDAGFGDDSLLTLRLSIPGAEKDPQRTHSDYRRFMESLAGLPNVEAVGLTNSLPLSGTYSCDGFKIPERPAPAGQEPCADTKQASPDYFRALGIPLLRGRSFSAGDLPEAPLVVVINQTMADRFWPGEDALGRQVVVSGEPRTIVGIVGDVKHFALDAEAPPEVYLPVLQVPPVDHPPYVVMRAGGDFRTLAPAVRSALLSVRKDTAIFGFQTMKEVRDSSIAQPRLQALLTAAFAILSVILAGVGVFSVMAYSVAERTHEIGIRMAIGAHSGDVLRLIFRQAMLLTVTGILLGLAGALALGRVLARFLFGVSTTDPVVFLVGIAVLAAVALIAAWLPALRATRVSPMQAFRS